MSTQDNSSHEEDLANPILIEFTKAGQGGTVPVGLFSLGKKADLVKKSNEAMEKAMDTIKNMAVRINSTIQNIENRPDNVEMVFGIKFDAEVGAIVAKVTAEGSMSVKLVWTGLAEKK